ncbi:MAG: fused MFS/spermidine synthase [Fimbriimonas sp.]|nr:fused MFS/spermidine synthase [Fimbriimonas sp.]
MPKAENTVRLLFTVAIFLNSALLFLIQPMAAKILLPTFGGSSAVWTTCMVFFQAVLLAGYAYAHLSIRKLGARRQALIHVPLMALAVLTLPFASHVRDSVPASRPPLVHVIMALTGLVGLVFFTVSAGAPMLQRWFATTGDPHANDPFFLYSASNLGSMIALFAYPAFFEPRFRLSQQSSVWTAGYVALVLLVGAVAWAVRIRRHGPGATIDNLRSYAPIRASQKATWVAMAAIPSSLLLGVTTYLTTNIAPMPLLWVLPLALYLLTFILAFARKRLLGASNIGRYLPWLVTPLVFVVILEASSPLILLATIHLGAFFFIAWMCHARLHESRPEAAGLTEFYLWISVGGVAGGFFNAVIAPSIFTTLLEYPIAIVLACFLRPARKEEASLSSSDAVFPVILGFVTFFVTACTKLLNVEPSLGRTIVSIAIPTAACLFAMGRPFRYGLSVAAVFAATFAMHTLSSGTVLFTARSFFGVHRVLGKGKSYHVHELVHGTTTHGLQDSLRPGEPLTYFTRSGPIGGIFAEFSGAKAKQHVAVAGLGVGTMAAYGQSGQDFTFFEIDPVVRDIALNPKYFTYVKDTKATVRIVMGDARLSLERQSNSRFGLIFLDAFSSDAIPIHLLTEEAIRMYLSKLAPHGLLVFNITNRYLHLSSMLASVAFDLHLASLRNHDAHVSNSMRERGKTPSDFVIMARSRSDFGGLGAKSSWFSLGDPTRAKAWTDDYSDILDAFQASGG